jgi:hypothetical protein
LCTCGQANRVGARYCRGCGAPLNGGERDFSHFRAGPVDTLNIAGLIVQPPIAAAEGLLVYTKEGVVHQISLRPGAVPWSIGSFTSLEAGNNRIAVTEAPLRSGGRSLGLQAVVACPRGVEALPLAGGESRMIYEAPPEMSVAAVRSGARAQSFCGVATRNGLVTFVVEKDGDCILMGLWLDGSRRPEELLTLTGRMVAGPLMCGERILVCTEHQVGLFIPRLGARVLSLPSWFTPFMTYNDDTLNMAPNAMPLALSEAAGAQQKAHIFGANRNRCGILDVDFLSGDVNEFRLLAKGAALNTMADGTTCLTSNSGILIYGEGADQWVAATPRTWMPATVAPPFVIWFEDHAYQDKQKIAFAAKGASFTVEFTNDKCSFQNCCGAYRVGDDFAVAFFDVMPTGEPAGLRLAIWTMTNRG